MTYVKPAIASLGVASAEIQSHPEGNKGPSALDSIVDMQPLQSTGGSYDLDE